jgi:hypothetical protein
LQKSRRPFTGLHFVYYKYILGPDLDLDVVVLHFDINRRSAFFPLDFARSYAILYGAYIQAQVAAYAIIVDDRSSFLIIPVDSLMGSVIA